ncbi:NmrA family transcriptional regulator [Streptomyces lucensis JCM 4490]|uniref:NmrA family transcriptional regulator n=1 Tax=Streptomyces lucensis JCM 4490 TaxID=1306176 RepID=A0A918JAW7_9ACTN|nr:NAD(P)H-binding protein [Streptomyces lucensis]GGW70812.1 NmrA family transcriptional regulator [Streptomyces lucensis JCM 4490]
MIVVTGATGNVGRALVTELARSGAPVTAVARRIGGGDVPPGVRAVAADIGRTESLVPALEGAKALFLLVAGEDPAGVLRRAAAAGVAHVVLLSTQGVGTRPETYAHAAGFESAVAGSGLPFTVLRSGGLASNALAWAEPVRRHRTVTAPFADVALPFVDPGDVAAAAATVLRTDGHGGHDGATYTLTGPEATTPRQRAAAIAEALGEPVTFVEQSREEAHAQMLRLMPPAVAAGTLAVLGEPTPEEQAVGTAVERLLGRPAAPFAAWAARNVEAFR